MKEKDSTSASDSDRTEGEISVPNEQNIVDFKPEHDPETDPASNVDSVPPPDVVPDGGLTAWLQVLGSTAILVNTWGLINTFGVFQAYYETTLLSSYPPSTISWIGSTQSSLLFLVGVFAGPLYDAGYFRHLLITGMFLIVFGQFMTSLCTEYWQVLLAQGFCMGCGMGMTFLPSAAILSQYFARHRALALGIASAGSPVAGTVFPIIFSKVEKSLGFGWATRVIGFIILAMSAIPVAFMKTRVPPHKGKKSLVDKSLFRDGPYMSFTAGGFFAFLTLYVPFFYITLYAASRTSVTESFTPYLVTLLNAGSILGRLIPNALADRFGSLNLMFVCMAGSMILVFGWLGVKDLAGSVVFVLLYGAFSGGVVSLTPSVVVELSPDLSKIGTRMGFGFIVSGTAVLIGTPIAGAVLGGESENARWVPTILYAACGLLVATLLYATARFLQFRKKGGW
ncbi:major facilitator superfamily domain-containing protein [Apiosordaria backusii]|uniref:Major facilitator superfamily domain-containing protein n=1 Tax=Apiosordaria backusii TaxID=314023 RepID=A0AA40EZB1_9PEZI|nr:major facilitator superfamily domain-containing protein [Apiosordaria backusii]